MDIAPRVVISIIRVIAKLFYSGFIETNHGKKNLSSPCKRPKQARSQATYDAITIAAARVLVEHGYHRATTNRIAEAAGVGIGSLYEFFPNKDAIFTEVHRQLNEKMMAIAADAITDAMDLPLPQAIRQMVETMIAMHSVNPKLEKALKEWMPERALIEQTKQVEERLLSLAIEFLQRHKETSKNIELPAFIVLRTVDTLSLDGVLRFPTKNDQRALIEELTDLIARYVSI